MSLEITKDRRVLVRAPQRAAKKDIDAFVTRHEAWIQKHLAAMPPPPPEPTAEEIAALKAKAAAVLPNIGLLQKKKVCSRTRNRLILK